MRQDCSCCLEVVGDNQVFPPEKRSGARKRSASSADPAAVRGTPRSQMDQIALYERYMQNILAHIRQSRVRMVEVAGCMEKRGPGRGDLGRVLAEIEENFRERRKALAKYRRMHSEAIRSISAFHKGK